MNESAIYNALLIEIEGNLEQLNDIDIKTNDIEKLIDQIKEDLKNNIQNYHAIFDNIDFLDASIANLYNKANKKLEEINNSLKDKYQKYYILNQTILELKSRNINKDNINETIKECKSFLNKVLLSTEYIENNENFLENVYDFVYKLIKLEIIFNNNDSLLEYAKTDSIHTTYLAKHIKEDIKDLSKKKQDKIEEKLFAINKNGFNDIYYLNKELLIYIIRSDKKEYKEVLENNLDSSYKEYNDIKEDLEKLAESNKLRVTNIKDTKKTRNKLWKKNFVRKSVYIGFLSLSTIAAFRTADNIGPSKVYKTYYTNYDSSRPEEKEVTSSFEKETNNELSITEYSPWESPGYFRDKYKRNIYEYEINNDFPYYEDVEDYLDGNFKEYIILSETQTKHDTTEEIPTENYTENKYVITQTYQDKTIFHEVENHGLKIETGIGLSFLFGTVGFFVLRICFPKTKFSKEEREQVKKLLSEEKQLLLEEKTKINTLTEQLNNLKLKLNNQYNTLPDVLKEDEDIQKRMRKLNESDNN